MRTSPKARRRGRFTLIELLVVIAIVMILAGLLMPVLAKAREKAHQTDCMSQLKGVGTAFFLYAADWDGHFPCYSEGASQGRWAVGVDSTPRWFLGPRVWYEVLDSYLGPDRTLYCPTSGFRYAINLEMQHRRDGRDRWASAIPIPDIDTPSDKFLVGDSWVQPAPASWRGEWQPLVLLPLPDTGAGGQVSVDPRSVVNGSYISGRLGTAHAGATTMLYADGRAGSFVPDKTTWGPPRALVRHWIPSKAYEVAYREYWRCWW
jgi:type II secretory pathway pseudopilin PulG